MRRDYLQEDLCYRDVHRDGKPFYQHEAGDPCDLDLQRLFSWDSFPGEGAKLLELGCGDGFVTMRLASMGLRVTGVDASPTAIQHAQENLRNAGLSGPVHVGDACDLAILGDGSFPFILDCHCLHCITDYTHRSALLRECRRLLTSDGRLFLATMGEQPMEWTATIKRSPWQLERKPIYRVDGKGCYVQSIILPGTSERVYSRIFIREELLRQELATAGLEIVRFERFAPEADPDDMNFLVELRPSMAAR